MLKGRIKGICLRGEVYWFGRQVNGRRNLVSLETKDYAEAVQRAQEIMERSELQPAHALSAEIERFVKYLYDTNRFSQASAESKGSILKNVRRKREEHSPCPRDHLPVQTFSNASKTRAAPSTAEG